MEFEGIPGERIPAREYSQQASGERIRWLCLIALCRPVMKVAWGGGGDVPQFGTVAVIMILAV